MDDPPRDTSRYPRHYMYIIDGGRAAPKLCRQESLHTRGSGRAVVEGQWDQRDAPNLPLLLAAARVSRARLCPPPAQLNPPLSHFVPIYQPTTAAPNAPP